MLTRRGFTTGLVATATIATPAIMQSPCAQQALRIRHERQTLDNADSFFAKYAGAVRLLHALPASDPRQWRNQALIHLKYCPHGGLEFPHWHRHYIANFEAICAKMIDDPAFALPYWNWSTN